MKPERCPTCNRKTDWPAGFECSHVSCPNRRPVTARPGAGLLRDQQLNLTSRRPIRTSDGDNA